MTIATYATTVRYPRLSRYLDATITTREATSNPLWRAVLGIVKWVLEAGNGIPDSRREVHR